MMDIEKEISRLRAILSRRLRTLASEKDITRYCSSDEGTINLLRYEILHFISTGEERKAYKYEYRDEKEPDKDKDEKEPDKNKDEKQTIKDKDEKETHKSIDEKETHKNTDEKITNKDKDVEETGKKLNITIDLKNEKVAWILSTRHVLEMLLFSGALYISGSINVLKSILERDKGAREGWRLRLAVAVAVTFGDGDVRQQQPIVNIPSYYSDLGALIDGLKRYDNFVKWAEQGELFEPFFELSAWHMRDVVGARVSDEELVWARNNVKSWFKNQNKIGDVTNKLMVKYKKERLGSMYTNLEEFYSTKWVTLKDVYNCGGACGAISHFGVAMVQAHGLPAVLLDQPRHVSYAWYKNGKKWALCDNDMTDFKGSKLPSKWCHWDEWVAATAVLQMEEKQAKPEKWRLVHKAQIITRIMHQEWQLGKNLSVFEEQVTTLIKHVDDRAFYNVDGKIGRDLAANLGERPGYTVGKELRFISPSKTNAKEGDQTTTLQFNPTFGKSSIVASLEHISEIRKVQLAWISEKYAPHKLYISYKLEGKPVFCTENIAAVPATLVDNVTIDLYYKKKSFDMFKIREFSMKGIAYSPLQLLVALVELRLCDNKLAKMCLKLILENC